MIKAALSLLCLAHVSLLLRPCYSEGDTHIVFMGDPTAALALTHIARFLKTKENYFGNIKDFTPATAALATAVNSDVASIPATLLDAFKHSKYDSIAYDLPSSIDECKNYQAVPRSEKDISLFYLIATPENAKGIYKKKQHVLDELTNKQQKGEVHVKVVGVLPEPNSDADSQYPPDVKYAAWILRMQRLLVLHANQKSHEWVPKTKQWYMNEWSAQNYATTLKRFNERFGDMLNSQGTNGKTCSSDDDCLEGCHCLEVCLDKPDNKCPHSSVFDTPPYNDILQKLRNRERPFVQGKFTAHMGTDMDFMGQALDDDFDEYYDEIVDGYDDREGQDDKDANSDFLANTWNIVLIAVYGLVVILLCICGGCLCGGLAGFCVFGAVKKYSFEKDHDTNV